jgi:hypothetical protein
VNCQRATAGLEVKVYDDARVPRDWYRLLQPWQCAVFFRRVNSESPVSSSGIAFAHMRDSTFWLFDRLAGARAFCEACVRMHPEICAEIYDDHGKARPPLVVVLAPQAAARDELGASAARNRKLLATLLICCSLPLFWWDSYTGGWLVLPTFMGLTMILAAARLLYINLARTERAVGERQRVEAHLAREREHGPR